jgi:hypothetical protein
MAKPPAATPPPEPPAAVGPAGPPEPIQTPPPVLDEPPAEAPLSEPSSPASVGTAASAETANSPVATWLAEGTSSLAKGALSLLPGLALEAGRVAQQEKFDEAAQARESQVGQPTQDQIEQQHSVGYELRGLDSSGRPMWEYSPSLGLRLRLGFHYLLNPFNPLRASGHDDSML